MSEQSDTPATPDVGEPVAWRYRDAWGRWAYVQAVDNKVGPTVITEKQPLYSLDALASSAAETARLREERDEWKVEAALSKASLAEATKVLTKIVNLGSCSWYAQLARDFLNAETSDEK